MAISSLKRLSFNRSSFIEVKNLLFRNDQEKIDCFMRFWDTFTYTYIKLFKVLRFYIELKRLRISLGYSVAHNELDHQEEVLIRINKYLRKKREEFLLYHRFNSFRDAVAKFITPLEMVNKEFKQFIYSDLTAGTKNLSRNLMLDMYNCDLSYFKNKIIPSLDLVMDHLKDVGGKSLQLNVYLVGLNTMVLNDSSQKIKRIIGLNLPLIKSLLSNDISISTFHVQRNEVSMKFLEVDESSEGLFGGETFFGSQLVTLEAFQKIIISDSLCILEKLMSLFTSLINSTQSSMDYFFKLSSFLEMKLGKSLIEFRDIYANPFEIQENLRSSSIEMSSTLVLASEMLNECMNFKEYIQLKFLIEIVQVRLNVINTTYGHIVEVLQATEKVNELDRTDKFQQRFKIVIDSLSCGILGLDGSIDDVVKPLEGSMI